MTITIPPSFPGILYLSANLDWGIGKTQSSEIHVTVPKLDRASSAESNAAWWCEAR